MSQISLIEPRVGRAHLPRHHARACPPLQLDKENADLKRKMTLQEDDLDRAEARAAELQEKLTVVENEAESAGRLNAKMEREEGGAQEKAEELAEELRTTKVRATRAPPDRLCCAAVPCTRRVRAA